MPTVILDAGHGRNTPGKRTLNGSKGVVNEWTINNAVCVKIQKILSAYNVTVRRTDDTDGSSDVSLASRVSKTNSINPDLFVSIHHNAVGSSTWSSATGVEVYYHPQGTANDRKIASILAPKLAAKTGLRNRGVKTAAYYVLNCRPTAILVEGGFMDSSVDYPVITSDRGQTAYAEAVAETIIEFLDLKPKNGATPTKNYNNIPSNNTNTVTGSDFRVRITTSILNIRKSDSFSSAVVGTVKKGQVFTIVKVSNGLGKLKSGAGWISMNEAYVEKLDSVGGSATSSTSTYKIKVVNCSYLNARKGPGTNYAVASSVRVGTVLTIVGETNGWLKTKSGLYVYKEYTKKI